MFENMPNNINPSNNKHYAKEVYFMSGKMKQKYWLKWLCALMLMVMCLFSRPQEAWAAGGTWNGCTWNWDGSTITVTSTTGGIPTVGRTSYPWYSYVSKATKIVVNVKGAIGDNAFYNCSNAKTVDLGASVSSVGASAFYHIGYNETVNLYVRHNGNISVGANAFAKIVSGEVKRSPDLYVHCWKKNTTSSNKNTYVQTAYTYIYYFDNEGASSGCSHPFLSGWQTNASQHWRNCSQCGQKISSTVGNHTKATNYSQSGGTLYKNCTTCQYRMETKKITYYVQYNGNGSTGGSTAKSTHTYDTAKALTANGFTRTGYQWARWSTNAAGTGTSYSNKQSVNNLTTTNGGTVNLYAIWTANIYTIAYNINGGKGGSTASSTHTYGVAKALTANGFTANDGFHFGSWNTQANGSGTKYTDKQSVTNLTATNKGTVTLYAQWAPNSFTVIFNGNGADAGSMNNQQFKYKETQALAANQFTRENYDFVGWSTNASATEADLEDGANGSALTTADNGTITRILHPRA